MNRLFIFIGLMGSIVAICIGFVTSESHDALTNPYSKMSDSKLTAIGARVFQKNFGKLFNCMMLEDAIQEKGCWIMRIWKSEPYWSRTDLVEIKLNFREAPASYHYFSYTGYPESGKWLNNFKSSMSLSQTRLLQDLVAKSGIIDSKDKEFANESSGTAWLVEIKKDREIIRWGGDSSCETINSFCINAYKILGISS